MTDERTVNVAQIRANLESAAEAFDRFTAAMRAAIAAGLFDDGHQPPGQPPSPQP